MAVNELELSMGMSNDYQLAVGHCSTSVMHSYTVAQIRFGSTNVRIGSTIFGERWVNVAVYG